MRFAVGKLSKLRLGYIGEKARATCCNIGKTGGDGREESRKKGKEGDGNGVEEIFLTTGDMGLALTNWYKLNQMLYMSSHLLVTLGCA